MNKIIFLYVFLIASSVFAQTQVNLWPIAPQTSPPAMFHIDGDFDGNSPDSLEFVGHDGVDIPMSAGTSVFSVAGGTVTVFGQGQGDFVLVADSSDPSMGWVYVQ